jgi:carbon storage regulator
MLVLTRYHNQDIRIGDDIVISILDVKKDGKVYVGIDAPAEVSVHRQEVYERIQRENHV